MSAPLLNPDNGSPTRATAVPARSTRKATAQQTGRIGITCSLLTTLIQAGDPPNEIANCGLTIAGLIGPNDSVGLGQTLLGSQGSRPGAKPGLQVGLA